jgi:hypothetical protein
VHLAADQLVGGKDGLDRFDHRVAVEVELGEDALIAQGAEHDALAPRHVEGFQALLLDLGEDFLGHFLGGFALQNDDHVEIPWCLRTIKNPPDGRVLEG